MNTKKYPTSTDRGAAVADVSILALCRVWFGIGCLSFGGPAAQIALMHRVIVDRCGWLSEKQYLSALSFCMLLPGPEAMQLATFSGWRSRGVVGGLIAGLCFVLPGALVVGLLAMLYALYGEQSITATLFLGIKAAVLVIVVNALINVSKKALTRVSSLVVAAVAFVAIFFFAVPFPLLVLLAGFVGFSLKPMVADQEHSVVRLPAGHLTTMARTVALWLVIWWVPVLALWLLIGNDLLLSIALFFSKLAVVTFGGAYAVLAYMAQDVVLHYQWLSASQMMDALGLAETTPGPLILVTEFVAFLAGFSQGGAGLAVMAAMVTLWVTFAPCFLWIFAGAPYMDWLLAQPRLKGALETITAAVVGVILNLSVWFALHVVFDEVVLQRSGMLSLWVPSLDTINVSVLALGALAAVLLNGFKWNIVVVLALCAGAALLLTELM